jgi:hypothetical protein
MWRICVLYIARLMLLLSLLLNGAVVAVWLRSFWRGEIFTRVQWQLSSDIDQTRQLQLALERGRARLDHSFRVAPAFIAPFTAPTFHQPDRTQPVGTRWLYSNYHVLNEFPGDSPVALRRLGIDWKGNLVQRTFGDYRNEWWWVRINLLWAVLLCFIFNLLALWMWRRVRRPFVWMRAGLCRCCGYDVRGSGDRCPECGNAVNSISLAPSHNRSR